MITDHAFQKGTTDFCIYARITRAAHGVTVREPCLKSQEEHSDFTNRRIITHIER